MATPVATLDDIMALLQQVSERLADVESKVGALSLGEFQGTINAQSIDIKQGIVKFEEGAEVSTLTITTEGAVRFEADVDSVHIGAAGKVDISGDIEELST